MKSGWLTFRIIDWLKHQQRAVQSVSQRRCTSGSASQVSDLNSFSGRATVSSLNCAANHKANIYKPEDVSEIRSNLECDYWSALRGQINQTGSNLHGGSFGIFHNGSYKFYRWDNAKACMVPYRLATPLLSRLHRSFQAFLSSWRLG
jgi:hypothetical protein